MGTSAYDIVNRALRINGVISSIEAGDAQDINDALKSLNMMIEQWSLEDLMCYYILNETFAAVSGTASYTIGPLATWASAQRPVTISNMFCRGTDNHDVKIEALTEKDYQELYNKSQTGEPEYYYYQPTITSGTVYLWPVPDAAYTIGISQLAQLTQFSELRHEIDLPPGYCKALIWNLAIEIAPEYGKQVDEVTAQNAIKAKALIKVKNNIIQELNIPEALLSNDNQSTFNIYKGY